MKKEKTVRTYQRRTKSGKMVTVHEHKASYDAAEEARKAAAKKAGAGSELSKKKAAVEENPLGFSADDYKEWYHWDMENDANNEAALRVEKALTKSMGKKAYNKYLEDMSNSYSARGHKKAHQALLDEHTASQKKQDAKSKVSAKDIVRDAKDSSKSSTTPKKKVKDSDLVEHYDQFNKKSMGKAVGDSFTFSEGRGKDKFTYDARFVTDGKGRYGYVVRDKAEGPDAKYYVGISDGYERHSQLPAGLRKAAEAQGLRFKNGEFVKSSDKPSSAKTEKANDYTIVKGPGMLGGGFAVKDGKAYRRDVTKKNPKWELMKEGPVQRKVLQYYKDSQYTGKDKRDYYEVAGIAEPKTKKSKESKGSSKKSPKTSGGAPTSADLRKQADEMDAKAYKETSKETHKKLIAKGYKKHTYQGTTYYHKGKEGSYGGSYVMLDKNGKQQTVPAYMKEGMKAQIARSVGKTYKPRALR